VLLYTSPTYYNQSPLCAKNAWLIKIILVKLFQQLVTISNFVADVLFVPLRGKSSFHDLHVRHALERPNSLFHGQHLQ
jgi:hypothetical protein